MCRSLRARPLLALVLAGSLILLPRLFAQSPVPSGDSSGQRHVRVSAGVMAGLAIEHKDPEYPAAARAKHISGAVVLHVVISPEGKVDEISPIAGPEDLREAAVTAVQQWTYKPYLLNGRPVYVDTMVTINFRSQD